MRMFLAILICKLGYFIGKRIGKGSSMPGKIALKICPDILKRLELPGEIIAVTGSNGKTSVTEMIAAILRADGKNIIYNQEGSNQTEGVTTLLLNHADWNGRVKADILLLESDERYAAKTFKYFHPTRFVVTNLYRDQLTRNGHPESVYEALSAALSDINMELILNADDPLSSCFGRGRRENNIYFGLDKCDISSDKPTGVYHDGAYCPVCGHKMKYSYAHYNHIGAYSCENCGHAKHATDFTGTSLDLKNGVLELDNKIKISLAFRSIYHVYNILAAYALCRRVGVSAEVIAKAINHYMLQNGRVKTFKLGARDGVLLTSKHENSIAYDTNLKYIAGLDKPCVILIIIDAVSRKYFTSETSWLWDIDFDLLNQENIKNIILSGRYCNDLAERFSYTSIPSEKWRVIESIPDAAAELRVNQNNNQNNNQDANQDAKPDDLYVVTCFSDRDKLLKLTDK